MANSNYINVYADHESDLANGWWEYVRYVSATDTLENMKENFAAMEKCLSIKEPIPSSKWESLEIEKVVSYEGRKVEVVHIGEILPYLYDAYQVLKTHKKYGYHTKIGR